MQTGMQWSQIFAVGRSRTVRVLRTLGTYDGHNYACTLLLYSCDNTRRHDDSIQRYADADGLTEKVAS